MDDLTLITGKRKLSGWQAVRVTRGIERMPSDFDIEFTERFPGEAESVVVKPGDECQVLIGNDLVITGYVDRFLPTVDRHRHSLRVTGRSKSQDLVDCSAEWPSNQISSSDVLSISKKLAQPYGIGVTALSDVGEPIPQFNLIWGETPYQIIERMARFRALLVYDAPDGSIILARAGTETHRTGFEQGINIERATALFGMDLRFSDYVVRSLSISPAGDAAGYNVTSDIQATAKDAEVPRHRLRQIIAETGIVAFKLSEQRGQWEAARRAGRSYCVQITTSTWRDGDGMLWTPNRLVNIKIPALKIAEANWLIADVTFRRDTAGTHADLTLMPPQAFLPQPFVWQPTISDVVPGQQQ
ncbi:Mu-like prophage tail protein gpP [Azospirillum oryzae]|uniref:Mu-like prophage tail protein gpP n=1 Tax=Azospirillum oryzae TaxID=286727 RepID=A0A1X7FA94_9PROT|nr:hypothetical protein [Azospirillum oryzae]SMF48304.1 Mu-like prophage tail protein gpP [Azospirillum oryzae]